jgi:hypothetical protein
MEKLLKNVTNQTLKLIKSKIEEMKSQNGFIYPSDQKLLNDVCSELEFRNNPTLISEDVFNTLSQICNPNL